MMSGDRAPLNIPATDDMDDFAPRASIAKKPIDRKAIEKVSPFPSREASSTKQMNITGDSAILDRFDRMCKADRRSRHAMLEILMDNFQGKGQGG